MASFAKLQVLGRASDDIIYKFNPDGSPRIAVFKVGVINQYKEVQWHKIAVKDPYIIGIVKKYVKPDCMVLVTGDEVVNHWIDDKGNKNIGHELQATEVYAFSQPNTKDLD